MASHSEAASEISAQGHPETRCRRLKGFRRVDGRETPAHLIHCQSTAGLGGRKRPSLGALNHCWTTPSFSRKTELGLCMEKEPVPAPSTSPRGVEKQLFPRQTPFHRGLQFCWAEQQHSKGSESRTLDGKIQLWASFTQLFATHNYLRLWQFPERQLTFRMKMHVLCIISALLIKPKSDEPPIYSHPRHISLSGGTESLLWTFLPSLQCLLT